MSIVWNYIISQKTVENVYKNVLNNLNLVPILNVFLGRL